MANPSKVSLVFSAILAALFATAEAHAQSALDGFDPMANGPVDAFAVQPDGKVLIGGSFTSVFGVPRNYIARLNADGTVDSSFNPNANSYVKAIVVQADGKILVGGSFQGAFSIGGQARNFIARLDPTTGAADSFNPNAGPASGGTVLAIAVESDGKILTGGTFTNIGGQMRSRIARLDPSTGLADGFNPNPHSSGALEQYTEVLAITEQRDGKVLVGGFFETIGGQARNSFARLDPVTGSCDSFNANADAHSYVYAIALQADDRMWVGGTFENIGGQARRYIARLDPIAALADSLNPNPNSYVSVITVQPDGKILVGGRFYGSGSIGGQDRNIIARLDPTTGLVDAFDPNINQAGCCPAPLHAMAVQADGKVLIGGEFTGLKPNGGSQVTRTFFARLEKDGRVDQTLNPYVAGYSVHTTVVQPDGKILIGGDFAQVMGVERAGIARLNTDGSLDMTFDPNAVGPRYNGIVDAMAVQADGKIVVGGGFIAIGGQQRNGFARLDPVTGLADSFDPGGGVRSIALQADGKILVGGYFTIIGGQARYHIARLDPATGLADSFDPNPTDSAAILAVQPDGKIWIGGGFAGVGGQQRKYLARLDPISGLPDSFNDHPLLDGPVTGLIVQPDGHVLVTGSFTMAGGQPRNRIALLDGTTGVATPFNPNIDGTIQSVVMQANGKLLVGGNFLSIGGQVRRRVGRIDLNTGLPDLFDPTANDSVDSIDLQADGKVLAGGRFYGIGGQTRPYLARLRNDDAALQELSVMQTGITWVRGGSSVQFARVTFEYSTDNANYTPLGNGTPAGSDWTLSGLDLPNTQNFYIRARGFYRTGQNNGSESIAESVRSVFLHEVSVANVLSRKVHGAAAFDINLPATGNPGIECRSGGASGNYQLVFSFANPITSVGHASLTSGTGSVSSRMIDSNDAHNFIVNLTGISNAQTINVTLTNVNDNAGNSSSAVSALMSVLIGDVNGNGIVNATDVAQTKANSGQVIDTTNFRDDLTANGSVNASDVALVKSCSGTSIPSNRGHVPVSKR